MIRKKKIVYKKALLENGGRSYQRKKKSAEESRILVSELRKNIFSYTQYICWF